MTNKKCYELFFSISQDLFCITGNDGYFKELNPAWEKTLGFSREELLSRPGMEFIHPEDRKLTAEFNKKIVGNTGMHVVKNRCLCRDGSYKWLLWRCTHVPEEGLSYSSVTDITELRRAEGLLNGSTGEMADLYNNAPCGYHTLDKGGFFVSVNDTELSWLGYTREELVPGRKITDLMSPKTAEAFNSNYAAHMKNCLGFEQECELVRKDRTILSVLLSATAIKNGDGEFQKSWATLRDITAVKRTTALLSQRESQLKEVRHLARIGHWRWNPATDTNEWSEEIFNICKRDPKLGTPVLKELLAYHTPESSELMLQAGNSTLATGDPHSVELQMKENTKDGFPNWISLHISAELDHNLKPARLYGTVQDISERKRAEEALRRSEEKYRKIFENIQDAFYQMDINGIITEISPSISTHSGYTREELLGTSVERLYLYPEDRSKFMAEIYAKGSVSDHVFRIKRKDGRIAFASANARISLDDQGRPAGIEGSLRDVTDRERAAEEIRLKELYLDNAMDSVVVHDLEGRLSYVNQAACRAEGYSKDELFKMNLRQRVAPEFAGTILPRFKVITEEGGDVFESVHIRKDGSRMPVAVHSRIIEIHGEKMVLSVERDITERKKAEEALRQSEMCLLQAQKMEAVGRLAGGVAHDFNNILSTISAHSEFLQYVFASVDSAKEDLDGIMHAVKNGARLTRQLLTFSRRQVVQPEVLDLNALLVPMKKTFLRLLGENYRIEFKLARDLKKVYADPMQLEQAVINIAINSRDAMPDGGELIIETKNVFLEREVPARAATIPTGAYVRLTFADTGCGMGEDALSHIFEPFFTTKASGKGTGLGLPNVYGIVKQVGGYITVESEVDKGSIFRIFLPYAGPRAGKSQVKRAEPHRGLRQAGHETLLLVEDDKILRRVTSRSLEAAGYTVLQARNGNEGLKKFLAHSGNIGLIITDLIMPKTGGRKMMERIKGIRPGAKVIYITGYDDEVINDQRVFEPGAVILAKPVSRTLLLRKIRELLDAAVLPENFSRPF